MIDLSPYQLEIVLDILKKRVPQCEVRVFGSRYKWTAKNHSDLDLAIVGQEKLERKIIYALKDDFSESDLPIRVDVLDWYAISDEFKRIIEQGYEVIQEKEKQLPDGWQVKKLGDVGKVITGKTPSKNNPEHWGNLVDFITPSDYNGDRFLKNMPRKLSSDGKLKFKNLIIPKYNILVTCIGSDMGKIGINLNECVTNQQINTIIVNTQEFNCDYIYYFLKNNYLLLRSIAFGGTTMPIINKSTFEKISIVLPPLVEQKAIADVLSALDDKIEVNQQINKKLEEMAQAIFKQWFVDFNFPDENGNPYKSSGGAMVWNEELKKEIPLNWSMSSLDEIATFTNGLAMQKFRPQKNEKSLPVLKIKELRQGCTDNNSDRCTDKLPDCIVVIDGDVIFSWSGTLIVDIWSGGKAGLNQHLFKIKSEKYSTAFYYLWIKYHLSNFISIAQGKATTMGHIQRKHLSEAKVICPNDLYVSKLNDVLMPVIQLYTTTCIEIKRLASTRDTLLPKLMSGEIRVL